MQHDVLYFQKKNMNHETLASVHLTGPREHAAGLGSGLCAALHSGHCALPPALLPPVVLVGPARHDSLSCGHWSDMHVGGGPAQPDVLNGPVRLDRDGVVVGR